MNPSGRIRSAEYLDEPWRRLAWVVPASVALWMAALIAFSSFLTRVPPAPPELPPAEVRFVELPPAASPAPAHHPAPAIVKPKIRARPHPHVRVRPAPLPAPIQVRPRPAPEASSSTAKSSAPARSEQRPPPASNESGGGSAAGSAVGSDSGGARAIYAPKPAIPEDLRDQAFRTVAVARFKVSSDGSIQVALVKPTDNPELNQVLLNTLRQWRFFPAMKGGVAINSQFEVRIPISVQ